MPLRRWELRLQITLMLFIKTLHRIDTNAEANADHNTRMTNNTDAITDHDTRITNNTDAIGVNTGRIDANSVAIANIPGLPTGLTEFNSHLTHTHEMGAIIRKLGEQTRAAELDFSDVPSGRVLSNVTLQGDIMELAAAPSSSRVIPEGIVWVQTDTNGEEFVLQGLPETFYILGIEFQHLPAIDTSAFNEYQTLIATERVGRASQIILRRSNRTGIIQILNGMDAGGQPHYATFTNAGANYIPDNGDQLVLGVQPHIADVPTASGQIVPVVYDGTTHTVLSLNDPAENMSLDFNFIFPQTFNGFSQSYIKAFKIITGLPHQLHSQLVAIVRAAPTTPIAFEARVQGMGREVLTYADSLDILGTLMVDGRNVLDHPLVLQTQYDETALRKAASVSIGGGSGLWIILGNQSADAAVPEAKFRDDSGGGAPNPVNGKILLQRGSVCRLANAD